MSQAIHSLQPAVRPTQNPIKQTKITIKAPSISNKVKLACFLVFSLGLIALSCFLGHHYSLSSPEVIASLCVTFAPLVIASVLMIRKALFKGVLAQARSYPIGAYKDKINHECIGAEKIKPEDEALAVGNFLGVISSYVEELFGKKDDIPQVSSNMTEFHYLNGKLNEIKTRMILKISNNDQQLLGTGQISVVIDPKNDTTTINIDPL